jgi:hypothetical protein
VLRAISFASSTAVFDVIGATLLDDGILSGAVDRVNGQPAYNRRGSTSMKRDRLWLAVVLVYAAAFRLISLNRPFEFDAEGSGSLNAVLARSYLRFDLSQTHGMPVLSLDPARATPVVFYPDHPPLVPLAIVPFYRMFGVGEWQTRLPIALMTIGAVFVLYRLVSHAAAPGAGLLAAAIFAGTPMTLYFGGFADVVAMPLILFALLSVLAYLRFQAAPGSSTLASLFAAFALAALCDWPAYVLVPVFAAHYLTTRPRADWGWIAAFVALSCALFAAVYVYITLATGEPWTWMADLFARRSAIVGGRAFTVAAWLRAALRINAEYHTGPLLGAAAAWTAWLGWRRMPEPGATPARLLLAWAAVYVLIGGKALYDHEWAWSVLTPALAVTAALLVQRLPSAAGALLVAAFCAWTTATTYAALYPATPESPFAPMQMADAVQIAARAPRDVALVVGNDADPQLWFYGDRLLRTGIWTIDGFERRLRDDTVDLMFDFDQQPWPGPAVGVVFPRVWVARCDALHRYLLARYARVPLPPRLADAFEVFDLRRRLAEPVPAS